MHAYPSLLLQSVRKSLDLASQGMGDETMKILARSMAELPGLEVGG